MTTLYAGLSFPHVLVAMVMLPLVIMGIIFAIHWWLVRLRDLHLAFDYAAGTLNQQGDLIERCCEALVIYRRLGPEYITSASCYASSYSVNHSELFTDENLEIVQAGIRKETFMQVASMLEATFRLDKKSIKARITQP